MIIQDGKPNAFHSSKLTQPQQRYTVTQNEFLSIVEILKEFRTILLGQRIKIYTDHKNVTCKTSTLIDCYVGDLYSKKTVRISSISRAQKIYPQMRYHSCLTMEINRLHIIQLIQRKQCQKFMTPKNCQRELFLCLLNSYTAISGKTPS